jgi:cytochrome bd-type quinol oxidase subunit 2
MPYGSIWGLLILIVDVWAIVNIMQSGSTTEKKVLWVVIVLLLPVVGVVLWYLLGRRTRRH